MFQFDPTRRFRTARQKIPQTQAIEIRIVGAAPGAHDLKAREQFRIEIDPGCHSVRLFAV
jgi:hypothetical protein